MKWLAQRSMLALAGLLLASSVLAQTDKQKPVQSDDEPIKLHTTLVQVPVVVKEKGGRYLTDLRKTQRKRRRVARSKATAPAANSMG